MLTDHPDVLAKLRAEILNIVGPSRAPTPDDFREMKYLRAVLNGASLFFISNPMLMAHRNAPLLSPRVRFLPLIHFHIGKADFCGQPHKHA